LDRLDEISAFIAVADARSFTQAARRLEVSPAQISKLVARLEDRLGARLLNRTTRDVSLTDTGRAFQERARMVLDEFQSLESSVREQSGPRGLLRISAPVTFGAAELAPALLEFAAAYPEVSLDVSSTDRMVNLVEEGFDVAVRIGRLEDSSLVARKLAAVRLVTCAAPAYLAAAGTPETPDDLATHEAIIDTNAADPALWRFRYEAARQEVRVQGRLRFSGAQACVAAASAGFGVTRSPAFAAARDLRAGRLKALLCRYEPEVIHVHAVYPHARHLAPKVRAFVDFLAGRYAGEPEWHLGWT
jgi:DNA-binding transcriptional LysR family regulator